MKMKCEGGCEGVFYYNQLRDVEIEEAPNIPSPAEVDKILDQVRQLANERPLGWERQARKLREKIEPQGTRIRRRFRVCAECEEPFTAELAMRKLANDLVIAFIRAPLWKKLSQVKRLMRLQHGMNERLKGFKGARRIAVRSAIRFVSPVWAAVFFERRAFHRRVKRETTAQA
jgi:hypothetical protein